MRSERHLVRSSFSSARLCAYRARMARVAFSAALAPPSIVKIQTTIPMMTTIFHTNERLGSRPEPSPFPSRSPSLTSSFICSTSRCFARMASRKSSVMPSSDGKRTLDFLLLPMASRNDREGASSSRPRRRVSGVERSRSDTYQYTRTWGEIPTNQPCHPFAAERARRKARGTPIESHLHSARAHVFDPRVCHVSRASRAGRLPRGRAAMRDRERRRPRSSDAHSSDDVGGWDPVGEIGVRGSANAQSSDAA